MDCVCGFRGQWQACWENGAIDIEMNGPMNTTRQKQVALSIFKDLQFTQLTTYLADFKQPSQMSHCSSTNSHTKQCKSSWQHQQTTGRRACGHFLVQNMKNKEINNMDETATGETWAAARWHFDGLSFFFFWVPLPIGNCGPLKIWCDFFP